MLCCAHCLAQFTVLHIYCRRWRGSIVKTGIITGRDVVPPPVFVKVAVTIAAVMPTRVVVLVVSDHMTSTVAVVAAAWVRTLPLSVMVMMSSETSSHSERSNSRGTLYMWIDRLF